MKLAPDEVRAAGKDAIRGRLSLQERNNQRGPNGRANPNLPRSPRQNRRIYSPAIPVANLYRRLRDATALDE